MNSLRRVSLLAAPLPLVVLMSVCTACMPPRIAPVTSPEDPMLHAIYLVAFGPAGADYLVLERQTGLEPRLYSQRFDRGPHRPIFGDEQSEQLERLLTPWPERGELASRIAHSEMGAVIEQLGYTWPAAPLSGPIDVGGHRLQMSETGEVRLGHADTSIALLATPLSAQPDAHTWLLSRDRRFLAVELSYAGSPRVRSLDVVALPAAHARVMSAAAFDAHEREHYGRAIRLWQDAARLDPSADHVPYNLACAYALNGEPAMAMKHLREAMRRDPARYRSQARHDSDLRDLHTRADYQQLVFPR